MSRAREFADLAGSADAGGLTGRNLIINGACVIDQRNSGSSVTPADTNYTVDRWRYTASQASKFTFQQNAGSVTPPAGFENYMGFTVASAVTVGSGDYFAITQRIEGYNVNQLEFGTSNAKTVTLSFWVRSSLTGTFGGTLRGASFGRSYPFTYAISSANTWEYKTVTVAGDTSGTYQSGNTTGLEVIFGLGVGSTYSGTAGAWTASGHFSATGAVSVVGTGSATWQVTGIQLEVGDTATPFEHRSYGDELAKCQRYYYKHADHSWFNANANIGIGFYYSSSEIMTVVPFPVSMRTQPSLEQGSGTNYYALQRAGTTDGFNSFTLGSTTFNTAKLSVSSNVSGTAGVAGQLQTETNGVISFDAEL
jgi:hypothetical protein